MAGADRQLQQTDVSKEMEAFRQGIHQRQVKVSAWYGFFGKALKPGPPQTGKLAFIQSEVLRAVQEIIVHALPMRLHLAPPGAVQAGIQLLLVEATTLKIGTASKGWQANKARLRTFRHAGNQQRDTAFIRLRIEDILWVGGL